MYHDEHDEVAKEVFLNASQNVLFMVKNESLIQHEWHDYHEEEDGEKPLACLLGSIGDDVQSTDDVMHLMPSWFAEDVVTLFDWLHEDRIYDIAGRFGTLLANFDLISPRKWGEIHAAFDPDMEKWTLNKKAGRPCDDVKMAVQLFEQLLDTVEAEILSSLNTTTVTDTHAEWRMVNA